LVPALLAGVLAGSLAACGGGSAPSRPSGTGPEVTEIRYQGWASQVTVVELAEALGYLPGLKLRWVGNTISGPQDIQSVATGAVDIGGAFNGAVVKLVAQGAPVQAVVGYYGSDPKNYVGFYTLAGSPIRGPRDLIGTKVAVNALGAHYEAVLDEYLKRGGLTPKEIETVVPTVLPPVNTEQALRAGQIEVVALQGAIREKAAARGGLHELFADYQLLGSFTAGTQVMRKDFLARNPIASRILVSGVARAIRWTQTQPRDVVVATFREIITKRARKGEDASVVALWKSTGVAQPGGVIADGDLTMWIDWLRVNGQLTRPIEAKDVYTNGFNELAGSAG
jgi:ABC-type nitrate/sulfonate/bicarbonate transport system substrate-binding protein